MKNKLVRMPRFKLPSFHRAGKDALKQPAIGVTQGGSSRNRGARVAATDASVKQPKDR